jgi:hypothetical protein
MHTPLLPRRSADDRWIPNTGDKYFAILGDGMVKHFQWNNTDFDHHAWKFGNCFQTWKEAEYARNTLQEVLRQMHPPMQNYCAKHQQYYGTFCVYCGPPVSPVDGVPCVPQPREHLSNGQGNTPAAHEP